MRTKQPDVVRLHTALMAIEAAPGQAFYKTPKAWEIWQCEPPQRVKRIPASRVLFVETEERDGVDLLAACEQFLAEWERGREWISEDTADRMARAYLKATGGSR